MLFRVPPGRHRQERRKHGVEREKVGVNVVLILYAQAGVGSSSYHLLF